MTFYTKSLLSAQQTELTNLNDIYTSYKPIIISAINLLATDPSIDRNTNYDRQVKRSLLPFLGGALSQFTGTATTKDVNNIKQRVNQLIETQSTEQETMVHILSILKVTRYAAQVNRQHINILMDRVGEMAQDVNNHYNLTSHQFKLLSTSTAHMISPSESLRFTLLYQISCSAYHGLCWCSHYWKTFTPHFTHCRAQTDAIPHWRVSTYHRAFSSIIWGHITIL